jgi:hypothetical protein
MSSVQSGACTCERQIDLQSARLGFEPCGVHDVRTVDVLQRAGHLAHERRGVALGVRAPIAQPIEHLASGRELEDQPVHVRHLEAVDHADDVAVPPDGSEHGKLLLHRARLGPALVDELERKLLACQLARHELDNCERALAESLAYLIRLERVTL